MKDKFKAAKVLATIAGIVFLLIYITGPSTCNVSGRQEKELKPSSNRVNCAGYSKQTAQVNKNNMRSLSKQTAHVSKRNNIDYKLLHTLVSQNYNSKNPQLSNEEIADSVGCGLTKVYEVIRSMKRAGEIKISSKKRKRS